MHLRAALPIVPPGQTTSASPVATPLTSVITSVCIHSVKSTLSISYAVFKDINQVSPSQDVTRLAHRVLPPGDLHCICAALQTLTDTDDRY